MVGGSDAGAHLDRMCGSNYPTAFLEDCPRGRKLVPVTQAVHMMTGQPAALFGLRERGLLVDRQFRRGDVHVDIQADAELRRADSRQQEQE